MDLVVFGSMLGNKHDRFRRHSQEKSSNVNVFGFLNCYNKSDIRNYFIDLTKLRS